MVRSSVLIATLLTGCAVAQPTTPPTPPPIEHHATQPAAARPDPPPGPAGTPCIYKSEPPSRAPPLITPTDGACHRPSSPKLARSLAAQIRNEWRRHSRTGKLEIQDGCDRLGQDLVSLIVESKRSYGDPLTLTSLQRGADGHHDLVRIEYTEPGLARIDQALGHTRASETLVIYRAQLPDATVAPLFARLRAAVHIEVQEQPPPPQSGSSTGSMAHHFAVRIADDQGRGIQRSYQSWALPGLPSWTLPLAISDHTIEQFLTAPAIRKHLIKVGADDPGARDLFSRVFWDLEARASMSHSADESFRRRVLGLAPQLGSAQHIPALLAWLGPSAFLVLDEDRERVIAAIAAITGHNRRHDARGRPRPLEQVAAEAFAACSRSPAADHERLSRINP